MSDRDQFYDNLKATIDETTEFPSKYLYKFIIPNVKERLEKVQNIFNYGGAVIDTRESKTGKFISISILIEMQNSAIIIEKYKEADQVEGIISL